MKMNARISPSEIADFLEEARKSSLEFNDCILKYIARVREVGISFKDASTYTKSIHVELTQETDRLRGLVVESITRLNMALALFEDVVGLPKDPQTKKTLVYLLQLANDGYGFILTNSWILSKNVPKEQ